MTQQTYTPDWSKAPQQANWWARDKDGSGFWYSKRPSAHRHSFIADCCFVAADNDCPFIDCSFELDNWRDTLTVRPFQDRDIPQNLSDYFSGKTPFITAYVDLLLARMAKEQRFGEDVLAVYALETIKIFDVVLVTNVDDDSKYFAIPTHKWMDDGAYFFNAQRPRDDGALATEFWEGPFYVSEFIMRPITELEAVEFRKAMEAVYG